MSDTRKDVVIIGSGPAGLSAAVYAKRALLDVAVIEKEMFSGGQIVTTDRVDNLLGFYGTNGYDQNHLTLQGEVNSHCYRPGTGMTSMDALAIQKSVLGLVTLPQES